MPGIELSEHLSSQLWAIIPSLPQAQADMARDALSALTAAQNEDDVRAVADALFLNPNPSLHQIGADYLYTAVPLKPGALRSSTSYTLPLLLRDITGPLTSKQMATLLRFLPATGARVSGVEYRDGNWQVYLLPANTPNANLESFEDRTQDGFERFVSELASILGYLADSGMISKEDVFNIVCDSESFKQTPGGGLVRDLSKRYSLYYLEQDPVSGRYTILDYSADPLEAEWRAGDISFGMDDSDFAEIEEQSRVMQGEPSMAQMKDAAAHGIGQWIKGKIDLAAPLVFNAYDLRTRLTDFALSIGASHSLQNIISALSNLISFLNENEGRFDVFHKADAATLMEALKYMQRELTALNACTSEAELQEWYDNFATTDGLTEEIKKSARGLVSRELAKLRPQRADAEPQPRGRIEFGGTADNVDPPAVFTVSPESAYPRSLEDLFRMRHIATEGQTSAAQYLALRRSLAVTPDDFLLQMLGQAEQVFHPESGLLSDAEANAVLKTLDAVLLGNTTSLDALVQTELVSLASRLIEDRKALDVVRRASETATDVLERDRKERETVRDPRVP
ncbi:hypothetical protein K1X76_01875 [bacterium]|nr:hypothetical protein [bacterium]